MNKIAVLSDIHGNLPALERVDGDIRSRGVDCVFNLGDHVSGPLWPQETVRYLMTRDWIQISGNHERQLANGDPGKHGLSDSHAYRRLDATELDWLGTLPASLEIGKEFLLIHGGPEDDTTYLLETVGHGRARLATPDEIHARLGQTTNRIILCGHTHVPRVVALSGKMLIVNPGSVGLPAYEDDLPEYHVMENGSPHARYAVLNRDNGGWRAELISVPYDHERASAQARRNGRPDWETALRTGFMPC